MPEPVDFGDYITAVFGRLGELQASLIIDEYDTPLNHAMGAKQAEIFQSAQYLLRLFFTEIKTFSRRFHLIFVTGITRYHAGFFSGFNNYQDLSFDLDYATLVGFTEEEIRTNFAEHLEYAAQSLSTKHHKHYTADDIMKQLRFYYNGYNFAYDLDMPCAIDEITWPKVYNPVSIINFLAQPQYGYRNYWTNTGALPTFLNKAIKRIDFNDLVNYFDLIVSQQTVAIDPEDFNESHSSAETLLQYLPLILYQSGYLTIKGWSRTSVFVGIPNHEVKQAFQKLLWLRLTYKPASLGSDETSHHDSDLVQAAALKLDKTPLRAKVFQKALIDPLNTLLDLRILHSKQPLDVVLAEIRAGIEDLFAQYCNSLSNDSVVHGMYESQYCDFIEIFFKLADFITLREKPVANGYADMVAFKYGATQAFVFEFKVAKTERSAKAMLTKALKQIDVTAYARLAGFTEVYPFVVVIVNQYLDKRKKAGSAQSQNKSQASQSKATAQVTKAFSHCDIDADGKLEWHLLPQGDHHMVKVTLGKPYIAHSHRHLVK